jgi:hypothetical protein
LKQGSQRSGTYEQIIFAKKKKWLRAIDFHGNSMDMDGGNVQHSFLNFMIFLETLLLEGHEQPKGLLAERIALLNSTLDHGERILIFDGVQRL